MLSRGELARSGRSASILALPALTSAGLDELVTARQAARSRQSSFLDDTQQAHRAIEVVGGLVGRRDGVLLDDAGVLGWQVTERQARAAQRVLADEAQVQTSTAGVAGFAALVRALLADRQSPVRSRRLPREPGIVVLVTIRDSADTPESDPYGL